MFLGFLLNYSNQSSHNSSSSTKSPSSSEYFQAKAVVVSPIRGFQEGRIKLHGIFWFAKLAHPNELCLLECGSLVTIIGRERNTLVVRPDSHNFNELTSFSNIPDSRVAQLPENVQLN